MTLRAEDEANKEPLVSRAAEMAGHQAVGEHTTGAPASRHHNNLCMR